jgi:glutamyl-tRNA reductase
VLSIGVELAGGLCAGAGRRALVVGRSRTASAACDRLLASGWSVTSAASLPTPSRLGSFLDVFDAVVTCTGTSDTIVPADAVARRNGRPLVVIDLSVPRDVDPRAGHAAGVQLYDVDALAARAAPAVESRHEGLADAERIVDEELERFDAWRADRMLAPTIKDLRGLVRAAVADTVDADPPTVERIVARVLHAPMRCLREAAADGRGTEQLSLVRSLFGLDDEPDHRSSDRRHLSTRPCNAPTVHGPGNQEAGNGKRDHTAPIWRSASIAS